MRPFPAFSRICPSCRGTKIAVIDSRPGSAAQNAPIRRRRKCKACEHRWTTYEVAEESIKAMHELAERLRVASIACEQMIGVMSPGHNK